MSRPLSFAVLSTGLLSLLLGPMASAGPRVGLAAAGPTSTGIVQSVYDGDTLTLTDGHRVRLLQIDTPELGSGECYSRAARTALLRFVPVGSRLVLESDNHLDRVDRYGRLLRYVHRAGLNVNVELVRTGAAAPYFYHGETGRYAATLTTLAKQAKVAKRGLWKACPSTVLDQFRAISTKQSGPATTQPANAKCDPNYAGGCVPPYPPDIDCSDIRAMGIAPVRVVGSDPHHLDGDKDGFGCE
jgi:micrococcal nuclease